MVVEKVGVVMVWTVNSKVVVAVVVLVYLVKRRMNQ